jgi:hypothetical protein
LWLVVGGGDMHFFVFVMTTKTMMTITEAGSSSTVGPVIVYSKYFTVIIHPSIHPSISSSVVMTIQNVQKEKKINPRIVIFLFGKSSK